MNLGCLVIPGSLSRPGCLLLSGSLAYHGCIFTQGLGSRPQMSVVHVRDGIGVSNWQAFQLAPMLMEV